MRRRFTSSPIASSTPSRRASLAWLAASLSLALAWPATASTFPAKPVTVVVPFAAGGPSDRIARDLAEALRRALGQPVVVENVGGAGGTIGTARVARADPDGYTLLVHHIGMATAPSLYPNLTYQVPDSFTFVGLVNEAPSILIGRPNLEAKDFAALRTWIQQQGQNVNLANAGVGSASHLCGLMLQDALKTEVTAVPYKGTGPAMIDLLSGQVDLMCEQATNAVQHVAAGKVRAYGVTSRQRLGLDGVNQVPTLDEAGLKDFNVTVWHGVYAPAGVPEAVSKRLNDAVRTAIKDPDFIKRQEALGLTLVSDDRLSPAGHRRFVEQEVQRWRAVIGTP